MEYQLTIGSFDPNARDAYNNYLQDKKFAGGKWDQGGAERRLSSLLAAKDSNKLGRVGGDNGGSYQMRTIRSTTKGAVMAFVKDCEDFFSAKGLKPASIKDRVLCGLFGDNYENKYKNGAELDVTKIDVGKCKAVIEELCKKAARYAGDMYLQHDKFGASSKTAWDSGSTAAQRRLLSLKNADDSSKLGRAADKNGGSYQLRTHRDTTKGAVLAFVRDCETFFNAESMQLGNFRGRVISMLFDRVNTDGNLDAYHDFTKITAAKCKEVIGKLCKETGLKLEGQNQEQNVKQLTKEQKQDLKNRSIEENTGEKWVKDDTTDYYHTLYKFPKNDLFSLNQDEAFFKQNDLRRRLNLQPIEPPPKKEVLINLNEKQPKGEIPDHIQQQIRAENKADVARLHFLFENKESVRDVIEAEKNDRNGLEDKDEQYDKLYDAFTKSAQKVINFERGLEELEDSTNDKDTKEYRERLEAFKRENDNKLMEKIIGYMSEPKEGVYFRAAIYDLAFDIAKGKNNLGVFTDFAQLGADLEFY